MKRFFSQSLKSCVRAASFGALLCLATAARAENESAAEVGRQLANPISSVWALFTEFDLAAYDGDVDSGNAEIGSRMIFQPVLPVPLFGSQGKRWSLISRPTIPVIFSAPIPRAPGTFTNESGLGDIQIPMVVSPPTGNWILGLGPALLVPAATEDVFGRKQWGVGPAAVVGYKSERAIFGAFAQYYSGFGHGDDPRASYLNLLYFAAVDLRNAWQVGFSPTITYDADAGEGDKWNVPVGLFVAKTTYVGRMPVKFQVGAEYSVVREDTFGQRAQLTFSVIPVIPSLVKSPLFGR